MIETILVLTLFSFIAIIINVSINVYKFYVEYIKPKLENKKEIAERTKQIITENKNIEINFSQENFEQVENRLNEDEFTLEQHQVELEKMKEPNDQV